MVESERVESQTEEKQINQENFSFNNKSVCLVLCHVPLGTSDRRIGFMSEHSSGLICLHKLILLHNIGSWGCLQITFEICQCWI